MGQDFFKFLQSEIILNILSRLPTETTMSCKCVCKPMLNLLTTPEFVKSHLSKSVPRLAVYEFGEFSKPHLKPYKIAELVDHKHRWNAVLNFDLPFNEPVHSSADGVLFLGGNFPTPLILCNPITREYIVLPSPRLPSSKFKSRPAELETYGFGVSRVTREYKVVRIFFESKPPFGCQVYTVGTGSWRKIATGKLTYVGGSAGAFLNGNLHWLAKRVSSRRISCLDLETELYSSFSLPPHLQDDDGLRFNKNVSALGDSLCLCEITFDGDLDYEIQIWLMKEYGDEESWTKEFIIRKAYFPYEYMDYICPIKVFEDGDILMEWGGTSLLYYCSKTKSIREVYASGADRAMSCSTALYAPSFLPLKTFAVENVSSF